MSCHHIYIWVCSNTMLCGVEAMFSDDKNMGILEKIYAPSRSFGEDLCAHCVACEEFRIWTLGWRHAIRACNLCKAHYLDSLELHILYVLMACLHSSTLQGVLNTRRCRHGVTTCNLCNPPQLHKLYVAMPCLHASTLLGVANIQAIICRLSPYNIC